MPFRPSKKQHQSTEGIKWNTFAALLFTQTDNVTQYQCNAQMISAFVTWSFVKKWFMVADCRGTVLTLDDVTTAAAAATHWDDITTLLSFSWQLSGTVANLWNHSDAVYSANVAIIRNTQYYYHQFSPLSQRPAATFLWPMPLLLFH